MKKNGAFLLSLMLFIGSMAFSLTPERESLEVRNRSSQTLIISREFNNTHKNSNLETRRWEQNICGLVLTVTDILLGMNEYKLFPGEELIVIYYDPVTPRLEAIPFMDKMRNIFKSLRIATEDGKTVITLDNLEQYVRKQPDWPKYIVEIR